MAQFELVSKATIWLNDPKTGKPTGEKIKAGIPLCITLPDGKFSAGNLFASARTNPIVMMAVNTRLGLQLTPDQFSGANWKILSSKT